MLGLGSRTNGNVFVSSKLNLFDEIFVWLGCELFPFFLIQIHIIAPQSRLESVRGGAVDSRNGSVEFKGDTEFVILHLLC